VTLVDKKRKSICIPNFDEISQFTAEIKLLPVSENGRRPHWNSTSRFKFDLFVIKSCHSGSTCRIS